MLELPRSEKPGASSEDVWVIKIGIMQRLKTYYIKIKEFRNQGQSHFVVSASFGPLGSIITEGKNLRDACRNLIEALDLALEKSEK